jgi:hypothetical protein
MRRTEAGFSTIEVIVIASFVSVFLVVATSTVYFTFARNWLERSAYEANVCMASHAEIHVCKRELRQSTSTALPFGEIKNLELHSSSNEVRTRAAFWVGEREIFKIEDARRLPFQTRLRRGRR